MVLAPMEFTGGLIEASHALLFFFKSIEITIVSKVT